MAESLEEMAEAVSARLGQKLGARGAGLEARLRHAGRRLPRSRRRDGAALAEALKRADHPRLSRQVDMARLRQARNRLVAYLDGIDMADRRKGAALGVLAGLAVNLLLLGAALAGFLAWRGGV
ncbi:hypothetical protein Ga0609869_003372 [Rhodovulum iodosum]|uniref:DUF3618 domain-containing protein n=1 Tax=Rhodovulum iodosum TaxID=68291 RepID=A0ABV3XXI7_9RHOB|nr:hypothetical protein [Rhodovulum robiginosum]RSK37834.1 hypothetical protein EJA01_04120 [Rhodovulum robiginosum]